MPYDSSGNASVTRNIAVTGQNVLAEQVNTPFADIQNMLSQVVLRSGVAPMTGNLNMNGNNQTNVGDPDVDTDGANKGYVDTQVATASSAISSNARKIETVNANRLALLADKATSLRVTGTRTITLTAAATLLANWWCEVWAVDGQVTIDPDASETINGNATLILNAGQKAIVFCTGTAFFAFVTSDAQSGVQLQGYSFGLGVSNNSIDPSNDIDVASGKAASDVSPFYIMQLSSPISKDVRFPWAVGSNQGGLDTGGVAASGTYYIWLIQRSDTLVSDVLFSISSSAPTMPTSYDRKKLIGSFARVSGANGAPSSSLSPLSVGISQTWQAFTRLVNTSYQNNTGRSIVVSVNASGGASTFQTSPDNSTWVDIGFSAFDGTSGGTTNNLKSSGPFIISPGWYYRVSGSTTISSWAELR